MRARLKAISLSHRTAPLDVRERFALNEAEAKQLLQTIRELSGIDELLVVSTCNRTEVYYVADDDFSEQVAKRLCIQKGVPYSAHSACFRYLTNPDEAVLHLFNVSIGLESKVVGDLQITHQIKQAYQWAVDVDTAGPFLHRLMHTIFFAGKRVAQETSFREGAASVSYATVELIESLTQYLIQPRILLIGLGDIGRDVFKNLLDASIGTLSITNRTREKADALAEGRAVRVIPFNELIDEIQQADVIVSSVRKDEPLITRALVQSLSLTTYKFFIDLSVPRSIDPAIEDVPGIALYNIDTLRSNANDALQKRLAAIPQVEQIVREAIGGFNEWASELALSPTIQRFKDVLEQIRKDELTRHLKHVSADEASRIEKITSGIIQKIIRQPVLQFKAACKRGEADALADVLQELFALDNSVNKLENV
ncbi:glutamyl-tRNA reductase [Fibrisoma montanum]|uniref:Glutamyl-tRNA reductase n=1 Tax=Fibrisoma montanum TaxID=2305895 RepID=A0A418MIC5_9BACT|nr:glutamyl-tRNA reductase [Fibrisoma montanum]RIV27081.1 glutamyl-tRNA reductase [Fibrisoma montanum]